MNKELVEKMQYEFNEEEHLHSLNGKALTGTSSVGNVLAKGGLTWWASGMACTEFGWLNPKKHTEGELELSAQKGLDMITSEDMTIEEYQKLLQKAYYAHSTNLKKTAKKGTDLHAELEDFVKGVMGIMPMRKYDSKIQPFIEWSQENVDEFLWSEAHCYDEKLWVGGISDTGVRLKNGKLAVVDFKSSKEAYLTQFIQDAGYSIQIERNGLWDKTGMQNKKIEGKFDALIVIPFGAEVVEPVIRYNVNELKQGFIHAVGLYRLMGKEKTK